jgi:DNA-binding CsgD family transcriptional regulator
VERVEPYGGGEVTRMVDGLLVTFLSARQAVLFALATQRSLAKTVFRVRLGIDTAEVCANDIELGNGGWAARAIGRRSVAGEVIVSDVVRQLVGMVPGISFVDLGRSVLEGRPERLRLWVAQERTTEPAPVATIGRVSELADVTHFIESTMAGNGRMLLIEGEAGIGKTHLVREAVTRARWAGLEVIEVVSDELIRRPGALAFAIASAVPGQHAQRARLHALLESSARAAGPNEDVSWGVVEAAVDLLEGAAAARPLVLATEDLHWCDDLSLAVLAAIARRVTVSRFSVFGSFRPSPRPLGLDRVIDIARKRSGHHLRLGSLDDVDVHALASIVSGAVPGSGLRTRLQAASGNPLFITELVRSLDEEGLLQVRAGVADVIGDVHSAGLHETLLRRLSWLPTETKELLRLASLLGGAFTLRDLSTITGRLIIDTAASLREAFVAGLVVGDGDRLAFRHDVIRESVYENMLVAERRDLHRAAGSALAQAGAPTQQVAVQFALGALPGDLDAVAWLEKAALETLSVSPSNALTLFEQAIALASVHWPGRAAMEALMIEPLAMCGRFAEAEAMSNNIIRTSQNSDIVFTALRGMSAVLGLRGETATAIDALRRAADFPAAPPNEAQRLRCVAAHMALLSGKPQDDGSSSIESARRTAQETLAVGEAEDDPVTLCLAHQSLGVVAILDGDLYAARENLRIAVTLMHSGRLIAPSYLMPDTFHAFVLMELDEVEEARAAADLAYARAYQRGALSQIPSAYLATASARIASGRWDDAVAELEAGLTVIDETGARNYVLYFHAELARLALLRGNLAVAAAYLDDGESRFARHEASFGADWLFHVRAEFLAEKGDTAGALALAEVAWSMTAHIRFFYRHRTRAVFLVRLAMAANEVELAQAVTNDIEEGARRTPVASAQGAALRCRGAVDDDPDILLAAVASYRSADLAPEFAACCEEAATVLIRHGRRDEAISVLEEALAIDHRLGAGPRTARHEKALLQLGVRKATRHRRPSFGWDALTETEISVSRLASEGLTNPEIGARLRISRRTAETHLSHVFTKLGLTGRTQLAAEVTRRNASQR